MKVVELWFDNAYETEKVQGDLVQLMDSLNRGAARDKSFIILDGADGNEVMVAIRNINKAKTLDDSDAFLSE
jgi:hypothetical protein